MTLREWCVIQLQQNRQSYINKIDVCETRDLVRNFEPEHGKIRTEHEF